MTQALYESSIKSLPLLGRGKVRDIYAVGDDKLLIVTSDRLSAFDVVLPDPIRKASSRQKKGRRSAAAVSSSNA